MSASCFERIVQALNLESGRLVILTEFVELEYNLVLRMSIPLPLSLAPSRLLRGSCGNAYSSRAPKPLAPIITNEPAIASSGCSLRGTGYQVHVLHVQVISEVGQWPFSRGTDVQPSKSLEALWARKI